MLLFNNFPTVFSFVVMGHPGSFFAMNLKKIYGYMVCHVPQIYTNRYMVLDSHIFGGEFQYMVLLFCPPPPPKNRVFNTWFWILKPQNSKKTVVECCGFFFPMYSFTWFMVGNHVKSELCKIADSVHRFLKTTVQIQGF